jgi:mRNA interferase MazF
VAAKDWTPERRDIIWINCNPQAGREMKNVHPLLVLSPREFNARTGIAIGLPMTTAEFDRTNPFAVAFKGPKNLEGFVLTHQPKSFDWRHRRARPHPWKKVPEAVLAAACDSLNQIIELAP